MSTHMSLHAECDKEEVDMFCNKCGTKLPDDSVFCSKCGRKLTHNAESISVIACTSCSNEVHSNNGAFPRFCPKCGSRLYIPDAKAVSLKKNNSEEQRKQEELIEGERNKEFLPEVSAPRESPPQKLGMVCSFCSKSLTTKWKKCPYCDTPNPFYIPPEPETEKSVQQQADSQSQSALINTSAVCFIISIAALAIALFLEYVVMANMKIESYADLTNYNAVAMFDWFFFGLAVLCFIIRVICAFILAAHSGNLSGLGGFVGIGLVITIIAGIFTQAWGGVFILFGIVVALYITSKIKDWM